MPQPERQPIRVVTDSGCSKLPDDQTVKNLNVKVLPLHITFPGGKDIPSDSISADEFYGRLSVSSIPSTSAVNVGEFEQTYEKLVDEGATTIYSIHLPEKTSSTLPNARIAADTVMGRKDVKIYPVDTFTMSAAQWFVAEKTAQMAKGGASRQEIQTAIDFTVPRVELFAVFENLDYFKKGGRANQVKGFLLSLLKIQPILGFEDDGTIAMLEKERTLSKARERMFQMVLERGELTQAAIIHTNAPGLAREAELNLKTHFAGAIGIFEIGPTLAVHGGPNVIGYCLESKNLPPKK